MKANQDHERSGGLIGSSFMRWAGISAIAAGLIFAGIQPIHPEDVISSVNGGSWVAITSLKTVMSIFGLFAVAGLYARQVKESGILGLIGYILMTVFYAVQMCYSFTEALIFPHLVGTAPEFVEGTLGLVRGSGSDIGLGAFATIYSLLALFYLLGTLIFGIALYRAKVMPRIATGLLAMTGPLTVAMVAILPHNLERYAALSMAVALVWLGYTLWSEKREQF